MKLRLNYRHSLALEQQQQNQGLNVSLAVVYKIILIEKSLKLRGMKDSFSNYKQFSMAKIQIAWEI